MPKKYRVEMTLLGDATKVVDADEHTENYEDDDTKAKGIGLDACSSGQAEHLEWEEDPASEREAARRLRGAPPVSNPLSLSRRR